MSEKKHTHDDEEKSKPINEIEQLRQIVFGHAQQDLENRIEQLEQSMHTQFTQMQQQTSEKIKQIKTSLEQGFQQLEDKLATTDQANDAKTAELYTLNSKLSSELEMADSVHKQENDELHQRLDQEVKKLSASFNEQLSQALKEVTQVSNELNASKTDRKTLAKLLTTVASNLETGDDE